MMTLRRGELLLPLLLVVGLVISAFALLHPDKPEAREWRWTPPPEGYFKVQPVGSFAHLPGDEQAAAMVHRSRWEIRPENRRYNHTTPRNLVMKRTDPTTRAYDPRWNRYILRRVSGQYTGTTDDIFQWAAAKWGVPDNVLRTVALMESNWEQSNSGDVVMDPSECPPGYRVPCPVTFGIVGVKSTSWPGVYPWNKRSTAADVDMLGGWLRGCYEGWVWWLRDHGNTSRGKYAAGDLWGCVGAWYSGDWHDGKVGVPSGQDYIVRAQHFEEIAPWLVPGF
jgi:hypothetical protein